MSKIEAGKREISESPIDIDRLVQSCSRLVAPRAKAGKIRMTFSIDPKLPPVRGEDRAMKQIITNIMSNAVKFTPEGGTVYVSANLEPDGSMRIAIKDTGIGIAQDDISKAMAPFGQIESALSRKYQGTGLGLPLTKALVELHGGRFALESAVGVGTTVSIFIPRERVMEKVA